MIKLPDDLNDKSFQFIADKFQCSNLQAQFILVGCNYAIAEVQRLNATAQPVSDGWVKCSERMPLEKSGKIDEIVVLVTNGESVGLSTCYSGDLPNTWVSFSSYGDVHGTDITHWMPLPAAPELKVSTSSSTLLREKLKCPLQREFNPLCEHNWISSEGRTMSGYLCSICGDYSGPMGVKND